MSVNFHSENYQPVIQKPGEKVVFFNGSKPARMVGVTLWVHSFPSEGLADQAVAFWEWEKTVSKVMAIATAVVAAVGVWTALSGTGRLISATILASHGALWSTAFAITCPLGTVLSIALCVYYSCQYRLAKEELPIWQSHVQSIRINGDFGNQIIRARTRILSNNGADLTPHELATAAQHILTDAEGQSIGYDKHAYNPYDNSPPPPIPFQDVLNKLNGLARAEAV